MSDVVAVALVSAGSSLLGAAIGALTTYKVNLRNTEATIATADRQHEVELAKVEAENERLHLDNSEQERRIRRSSYHEYLSAVHVVFQLMAQSMPEERILEACRSYSHLHSGVTLFAPSSVRQGAYAVSDVYGEIWPALREQDEENPGKPYPDCWRDATSGLQSKFGAQIVEVTALMHADITRGVAEDPPTEP